MMQNPIVRKIMQLHSYQSNFEKENIPRNKGSFIRMKTSLNQGDIQS